MNSLERRIRKLEDRTSTQIEFAPLEFDPTKPCEWVPPSERDEPFDPRTQLTFD